MQEHNDITADASGREAPQALAAAVSAALAAGRQNELKTLVAGVSAPDLADVIELLVDDDRIALIQALGTDFDVEVLSELDEAVRDQVSEALPNEVLAKAVTELDTDDAAYVIESLEKADQQEILEQIPASDRVALQRNLEYAEGSAGRLMQSDFVAVPPFWTVGQVIDHMRETEDLPETFSDIFIVDPSHRVLGSVDLSRMLRSKRHVQIDALADPDRQVVLATAPEEEVARLFERRDLKSAPVVDTDRRLVGVITVDDVVEVIQDQAEEDIKALAGVGDEHVADRVLETARGRILWLIVNLGTAILASIVIKMFDGSIARMVELAVLMPIVASIGGNAGTQTMTVTVRALATNRLGPVNAMRVITREALVGLLNGLTLSLITAAVVFVWFGSGRLGIVIGAAIVFNLFAAALAGILVPLALDRWRLDPAPASGVFVTMVTDVIGFFAFLGLASIWLLK